jgi:autoinducer 2-degrading protein
MFVVVVEFTVRVEFIDRFLERVMQQAQDSLQLEVDCHVFDVCSCSKKKNQVLLYEVYTDKTAFDAHLASAHFRDFNIAVQEWVSDKQLSTFERLQTGI